MKLPISFKLFVSAIASIAFLSGVQDVTGVQKPRFGGNLKVADELIQSPAFLPSPGPAWQPVLSEAGDSLTLNFSFLPKDRQTEIEEYFRKLENVENDCHWILDYPFLNHDRHASLILEEGRMMLKPQEPDALDTLKTSACLYPDVPFFAPFRPTQYGFEANHACVSGRPFLDSISPVPVDPVNPFLSFKLNDVDLFAIPEERFQQVGADPDLEVIPGPSFYVFLKTGGLSPVTLQALQSSMDAKELMKSVLNNHAEIFLDHGSIEANVSRGSRLSFTLPEENPFHLIGERLRLQLAEAGFEITANSGPGINHLELIASPIRDSDMDLARFRIILEEYEGERDATWFEMWDELESSGRLIPLLLYQSQVAVRTNIVNVKMTSGVLDFSDAWILRTR